MSLQNISFEAPKCVFDYRTVVAGMIIFFAALDLLSMAYLVHLIPELGNIENNLIYRAWGPLAMVAVVTLIHAVIIWYVYHPPTKKEKLISFVVLIMILTLGHAFGSIANIYSFLAYKAGNQIVVSASSTPMEVNEAAFNGLFAIFFIVIPATLYTYVSIKIYDYYQKWLC
jgi:hypothetical protein